MCNPPSPVLQYTDFTAIFQIFFLTWKSRCKKNNNFPSHQEIQRSKKSLWHMLSLLISTRFHNSFFFSVWYYDALCYSKMVQRSYFDLVPFIGVILLQTLPHFATEKLSLIFFKTFRIAYLGNMMLNKDWFGIPNAMENVSNEILLNLTAKEQRYLRFTHFFFKPYHTL